MKCITRPLGRNHSAHHPHVSATEHGALIRGGALALAPLYGPAGLVGPAGSTDNPYTGMDPSNPVTWVREYNPQPGMISYLNFDGANINRTGTSVGTKRGALRL